MPNGTIWCSMAQNKNLIDAPDINMIVQSYSTVPNNNEKNNNQKKYAQPK